MARKKKPPEHANHERWLVSYADLLTLLFAFFVVMFSVSQVDSKKVGRFTESFRDALEWQTMGMPGKVGGKGVLSNLLTPIPPQASKRREMRAQLEMYEDEKVSIKQNLLRRASSTKALTGLNVVEVKGELVLRLPERLMFDRAEAVLHEEGKAALTEISEELKDRPVRLRVEGHTDPAPIHTPRFPSNWELSQARAMAVVAYLLGDGRIEPARLAAAGYGEYHPIAPNDSPETRAQNRRVDLIVVADLDRLKATQGEKR